MFSAYSGTDIVPSFQENNNALCILNAILSATYAGFSILHSILAYKSYKKTKELRSELEEFKQRDEYVNLEKRLGMILA